LLALETERLELVPLIPAHAAELFPQLRDPTLYAYLDSEAPNTVDILETQYRRWEPRRSPDGSQEWLNWAVRLRAAEYVGWVQATIYEAGRADLAYLVFRAHQRRGYAAEACRAVIDHVRTAHGVRVIRATIDPANEASIALANALGLVTAGKDTRGLLFETTLQV
jgi:ribosomal-protein-alanine N-acetyltransferase